MSAFYDITRTLLQAVEDLSLGIPLVMENEEFEPPNTGTWAYIFIMPSPNFSIGKSVGDEDENSGIMQISLFDADTGSLSAVLLQLADTIASEFKHGKEYTFVSFNDEIVYIQNTSRNAGRNEGGFFQMDISVEWISYVKRGFVPGEGFSSGFSEGFG